MTVPGIVASGHQFAAAPPAGIQRVATRGQIGDTASSPTTLVDLPTGGAIAVGSYLTARMAIDNAGVNGTDPGVAVTDPRGNTWVIAADALRDPAGASAGTVGLILYCKVTNAYSNGDDLTFTYGGGAINVPADCIVIDEWSGIHLTSPIAVAAVEANGSGTKPSVAITPTAAGQLVLGVLAIEARLTGYIEDTDTVDGSWVTLPEQVCDTGTNTGSQAVAGTYKIVTGTSAQNWGPTITSTDWAGALVVFQAA